MASSMRAFVSRGPGAPLGVASLPVPELERGLDLRVRVHAVATNPVDVKSIHMKANPDGNPMPIGWDCSGVVEAVGKEVTQFKVGDEVFYSGDLMRNGSFSELHVVDSRLVAHKPKSLSHTEAAAFPLVALTAMEALHENMRVEAGKTILIHPGGGGVGSMAIQLAKLAGLTVVATCGREETTKWAKSMGADFVISYKEDLMQQIIAAGLEKPFYIFNTHSEKSLPQLAPLLAPRGIIVGINGDSDIPQSVVQELFLKCCTLSFELMLTRPMLQLEQEKQGAALKQVAEWIDAGKLKHIHTKVLKGLEQLEEAEKAQEARVLIGKQVIQIRE